MSRRIADLARRRKKLINEESMLTEARQSPAMIVAT